MADTKFTPGPWAMEENTYGDEIDVYPLKDGPPEIGRWCEVATVKDYYEEYQANAHLIAAAPELYEALEDVIGLIPLEFEQSPMVSFAKAALAKARGEAV